MGWTSATIRKMQNFEGSVYAPLGPRQGSMGIEYSTTARTTLRGHFRPMTGDEIALQSGGMDARVSHVLITDELGGTLQGDRLVDSDEVAWAVVNITRNGFGGDWVYRLFLRAR